jgi:hypothetical protein
MRVEAGGHAHERIVHGEASVLPTSHQASIHLMFGRSLDNFTKPPNHLPTGEAVPTDQ